MSIEKKKKFKDDWYQIETKEKGTGDDLNTLMDLKEIKGDDPSTEEKPSMCNGKVRES